MKQAVKWNCPEELKTIYPEVEQLVMPLLKRKAQKVARRNAGITFDDAFQEGRLALMRSLTHYDYNRAQGEIQRYVNKVLDNTFNGLIYRELMRTRMPRAIYLENGEWKSSPRAPASIDDMEYDPAAPDNEEFEFGQSEKRVALMKMKILFRLKNERDREVFRCKTNPPLELWQQIKNDGRDPANPDASDIAKFLGYTKNSIDWSLYKIRQEFTYLSRTQFSDLYGELIGPAMRPRIHMSEETEAADDDFVAEVIAQRGLDSRPNLDSTEQIDHAQVCGVYTRIIDRYPWGCVLTISNNEEVRTIVLEGKFNVLLGEVFSATGGLHEPIPVPWYGHLAKVLHLKTPKKAE